MNPNGCINHNQIVNIFGTNVPELIYDNKRILRILTLTHIGDRRRHIQSKYMTTHCHILNAESVIAYNSYNPEGLTDKILAFKCE